MSSNLENMAQDEQTVATDMSLDLENATQGAPQPDDASYAKAIRDFIQRKCNDDISPIRSIQASLKTALSEVLFLQTTHAAFLLRYTGTARTKLSLNTLRAQDANASGGYILSDAEQAEVQFSLHGHIHNAVINEGPMCPDPHDVSAEVRVLNWLTASAALVRKPTLK